MPVFFARPEIHIRSYANLLQQELDIETQVRSFFRAGKYGPTKVPSSMVTFERSPVAGNHRLILNLHSPFILELAKCKDEELKLRIGRLMLATFTWPSRGVAKADWKTAPGLICGPHWNYLSPVLHEECEFGGIAYWPLTIHQLQKQDNTPILLEHKLNRRDVLLHREFKMRVRKTVNDPVWFLTYAPSLPVLLLAEFLLEQGVPGKLSASRQKSLTVATQVLLSCDYLFCLSSFFGVPLLDRTGTLESSVATDICVEGVPTMAEITKFLDSGVSIDNPVQALEITMMDRAKSLWERSKGKIAVCWSGGIDSSAALLVLWETRPENSKLCVILDDSSKAEFPSLYQRIQQNLRVMERQDRTISEIGSLLGEFYIVTGELGDQLFGSDRCRYAFPKDEPDKSSLDEAQRQFLAAIPPDVSLNLQDPWAPALTAALCEEGLSANGSASSWQDFFAPQLAHAPFEIVTLYDMLWWLNFSCKYQIVKLRCRHDGGGGDCRNVHHFYDARNLECWSCVKEFHAAKFPDLKNWKSYKQPLKDIIQKYHADDNYHLNKTKVGSLTFVLTGARQDRVEQTLGIVQDRSGSIQPIMASPLGEVRWGQVGVGVLLSEWLKNTTKSSPRMVTPTIQVNPWGKEEPSPFCVVESFSTNDERQRRANNPVTAITLLGKCSALLPPELVRGKRVLDLGACLGAMCYWCLYYGAKEVVGVEPQQDFCDRMQVYLSQAKQKGVIDDKQTFEVVCADAVQYLKSCEAQSFDIIVIAGVLHCFSNPVEVLLELARVVADTICIESVHPLYIVNGNADIPNLLELAPSAAVNKAGEDASFTGSAVVPSENMVASTLTALGFDTEKVNLVAHPHRNEDVLTYTGCRKSMATPIRYFLRCKSGQQRGTLQSLENCVKTGAGNERRWTSHRRYDWSGFQVTDEEPKCATSDKGLVTEKEPKRATSDKGQWKFDESIADSFLNEAQCHIPDYEDVVSTCLNAIEAYFGKAELAKLHAVDVGCAIGYTVIRLLKAGIGNVIGYDIAPSMLKVAESNVEEATADATWTCDNYTLVLASEKENPPPLPALDVVLSNWTVHFLENFEQRLHYLAQLYKKLKPGGMLLLTEKTTQDDTTCQLYYDWKFSQGVSREVISKKRAQLRGVLETKPACWYLEALRSCGFEGCTVLRAKFGFVTFIAYKPHQEVMHKVETVLAFQGWDDVNLNAHKVHFDASGDESPYELSAWGANSERTSISSSGEVCTFGFVYSGDAKLTRHLSSGKELSMPLLSGMYFCCPGSMELSGGSGFVTLQRNITNPPFFTIGGPVIEGDEDCQGRLPYIDGCTDSLLISPVVKGAACLNHLHFPTDIQQTTHTHPSGRVGIVVRGRGVCQFEDDNIVELTPGTVFCIPRNAPHSFTTNKESSLDVIAFHPDSDYGPTATDHPMVNRTLVDGVPASKIKSIQTSAKR